MKEKLNAIIIDDEVGAIIVLTKLLERIGGVHVLATEQNPNLGLRHIMVMQPDIIFLDVQMEKKSGITLLKEVKELSANSYVIIVSGFDDYTFEAFKNGAVDYLVKPVALEELEKTVGRIAKDIAQTALQDLEALPQDEPVSIRLTKGRGCLSTNDIVYLKASGSYTEIFINDGRKEICTRGLWLLERELPDCFFRIHRSTVVNTRYVEMVALELSSCTMFDGKSKCELPISKANIGAFNAYLKER